MRTLTCPHCFAKLECPDEGGVTLSCSACSENFTTPYPKAPLAPKKIAKFQKVDDSSGIVEAVCLIIMLVLGLFALKGCDDYRNSPEVKLKEAKITAWIETKKIVLKRLKRPWTADFGDQTYSFVVSEGPTGRLGVKGFVNSQNGFGAIGRSNFYAVWERTPDGLKLISFELVDL